MNQFLDSRPFNNNLSSLMGRLFFLGILSLFLSCSTKQKDDLFTISVESADKSTLFLSDISEDIEAIELELTDNSLLSPLVKKVCYTEEYIIVGGITEKNIWLFNRNGKFIRQIGSIGQGPGECYRFSGFTIDAKNKQIIIVSNSKYVCYDFKGKFIKESTLIDFSPSTNNIYYIDKKKYNLIEKSLVEDNSKVKTTIIYTLDNNMSRSDSLLVRKLPGFVSHGYMYEDFINNDGENTYLYFPDHVIPKELTTLTYTFVPDTLFQLKNMKPIPYLRVKFKNGGLNSTGDKYVNISNIYKSSRYVFCTYSFPSVMSILR